ncbi:heterokaryon incompatibility protein-domain-containing protein [Lophiotrema nucula]|uniref:Heterokaryon incompatibility protein-domain-containing protein n=1 Tax=Lophiotrema nucula TaxID=690887 RepID=A0A6A5ZFE2_9PLEO|nr:heterokaryon incompatibility protein-domain-containing protein [Lophiotrema nucula]
MPLSKTLRSARRQTSGSSAQPRRRVCRTCNNLDPRGHTSSVYQTESKQGAISALTLVVDALALERTKTPQERGCRYCTVLVQALDEFYEGWRGCRARITVEIREKGSIRVGIEGEKWAGELIEIYARAASRAPWPTLGTAHPIPSNSGSDDTFDFARRCIQDCLTNSKHGACQPSPTSVPVGPKRLVDVGRVTSPIRLIDTQGKWFQYATLSHCWGTGPILTATKANWKKLTSNIPFDALPPLFQDAIIITRQLGLRYIWIDSLCIIQDSTRDWETESSKMGSIYEFSYITISATGAADGSARCLADRRKPIRIDYENTSHKEFALRARKTLDQHPDLNEGKPAKPTGALMRRAWALQEHVLSTRVLHYTATELLFECKTSHRCECSPARRIYPTTPALIPKAIAQQSKHSYGVWEAWQRIVEQYSQRDLTVANDKLPAISGIAHKIKDATGSSYLAGLWKENLASDLLWSSSALVTQVYASDTYRAPTFSWSSLDTAVTYYAPDEDERAVFTPTVKLRSSSIALSGLNALGTVTDGSVMLRGACLPAILSSQLKDNSWEYTLLIKGTSAIRVSHDCMLGANEDTTTSTQEPTVRRANLGFELKPFRAPVLCLSVARYDGWLSGLVLGKSNRVKDAYERLGTFSAGVEAFRKAEEKNLLLV